jgi:cytosine/adenosine deaminase-related metal-dependent hydrolase
VGDSTVYRHLDTSVLMVGGSTASADICAAAFETVRIRVIRVANLAAANEQIPEMMPQMVVVLDQLKPEEREALNDRAKAVGALVLDVDPTLDETTRDEILEHAAKAAFERGLVRDEPPTRRGDPVS